MKKDKSILIDENNNELNTLTEPRVVFKLPLIIIPALLIMVLNHYMNNY